MKCVNRANVCTGNGEIKVLKANKTVHICAACMHVLESAKVIRRELHDAVSTAF